MQLEIEGEKALVWWVVPFEWGGGGFPGGRMERASLYDYDWKMGRRGKR
jgi:hypothetical protein